MRGPISRSTSIDALDCRFSTCSVSAHMLRAINAQLGDVAFDYEPSMGGEDFALSAEMVPSCRLLVGSSQPGRSDKVHNSDYQPYERSIAFGTLALVRTAVDLLS